MEYVRLTMIKIKYNDKENFEEVSFCRMDNLVTITPTTPNINGFTTYRLDGRKLGDFSDYTTVFNIRGNSVTYSNDGSVYEGTQKPTEEELRKQALLSEKSELEQWLRNHDYVGTKIATGRASIEEYADVIAEMNKKANRINEINELLK